MYNCIVSGLYGFCIVEYHVALATANIGFTKG
jgi:hypothetical protein